MATMTGGAKQTLPASTGESRRRRPGRRRAIVAVVAVSALALGGGLFAAVSTTGSGSSGPLVGRTGAPAPGFALSELAAPGRTRTSAEFRGTDLVVNFWASWCGPCRTEMATLQAAYEAAHGRVRFVGIDTNDTRSSALGFLRSVHVTYTTLSDPTGQVATAYKLFGLPTTVFVSATGTIVGRHAGQLDPSTLRAALQEAFGSRAAAIR